MAEEQRSPDPAASPPTPNLPAVDPEPNRAFDMSVVGGMFWTSISTADNNGRAAAQKALVTQDEKLDGRDNLEWATENILAHDVTLVNDKTGEMTDAVRLVLIGPDGKSISTTSEGAVKSLRNIVQLFGKPPWRPALRLRFGRSKTRRGFFTYNVTVNTEE